MQLLKQLSPSLLPSFKDFEHRGSGIHVQSLISSSFTEKDSKPHSNICAAYWEILLDFSLSVLTWIEEDHNNPICFPWASPAPGVAARALLPQTRLQVPQESRFPKTSCFHGISRKQHLHCMDKRDYKEREGTVHQDLMLHLGLIRTFESEKEDRSE